MKRYAIEFELKCRAQASQDSMLQLETNFHIQ